MLNFDTAPLESKVRALGERTAEEWFEMGMAWDANAETLPDAVDAYRRAIEASPEWVEAHINLGTTLYQLERMEEVARGLLRRDATLIPRTPWRTSISAACCDRLGDTDSGHPRISRRPRASPHMADAHLNLALAYEKTGRQSGRPCAISRSTCATSRRDPGPISPAPACGTAVARPPAPQAK